MDGYQFLSSIVSSLVSLAWPAAVFGSVYLFREKLKELLPLLRMKYKDFDVSFRLEQAEKEAAMRPVPADAAPEPTPEEADKFEQIAEVSPRAAILEARTDVEEGLRSLAKTSNLLTSRVQSFLGLTRLLRSRGVIDPAISSLLDDLRVLGNNAAHNSETEFSKEDAMRYRTLANQAMALLRIQEALQ